MFMNLYVRLVSRIKSEEGATAIEYALLAALIAVVIAAGASALGGSISALFSSIATYLNGVSMP